MPFFSGEFQTVVKLQQPLSLLEYLGKRFSYQSAEIWNARILEGKILVNHQTSSPDALIRFGDLLIHRVVDYFEPELPTSYQLLKKAEGLYWIHKEPHLPVHATGKFIFQNLIQRVRSDLGLPQLYPKHRLDVETSGCVVLVDPLVAHLKVHPYLNSNLNFKVYIAWVHGEMPENQGVWEDKLGPPHPENPSPIRCKVVAHPHGKSCSTQFRVLRKVSGYSLVLLSPLTGRRHQLRAQLALRGHPIVGDKIYSEEGFFYLQRLERELGPQDFQVLRSTHHLLHCLFSGWNHQGQLIGGWDFFKSSDWKKFEKSIGFASSISGENMPSFHGVTSDYFGFSAV